MPPSLMRSRSCSREPLVPSLALHVVLRDPDSGWRSGDAAAAWFGIT